MGLHQGCNSSPLLFSLFMNDLEDYLKNHSSGSCQLNSYRLQLMMFADDIVLLADIEKGLQESLNGLEKFCSNWDLSINIEKLSLINPLVALNFLYTVPL